MVSLLFGTVISLNRAMKAERFFSLSTLSAALILCSCSPSLKQNESTPNGASKNGFVRPDLNLPSTPQEKAGDNPTPPPTKPSTPESVPNLVPDTALEKTLSDQKKTGAGIQETLRDLNGLFL